MNCTRTSTSKELANGRATESQRLDSNQQPPRYTMRCSANWSYTGRKREVNTDGRPNELARRLFIIARGRRICQTPAVCFFMRRQPAPTSCGVAMRMVLIVSQRRAFHGGDVTGETRQSSRIPSFAIADSAACAAVRAVRGDLTLLDRGKRPSALKSE